MSSDDKNKTYGDLILEELKTGEKSLKTLKDSLHIKEIREPLATLLRKGKIRISGFDAYETKTIKGNGKKQVSRKHFAADHLLFEKGTENSKLHIFKLFRRMESENTDKSEEAIEELLVKFKNRFKDYQEWEKETLETMMKCVTCVSYNKVIQEIERIIKNDLQLDDSSIDEDIKEFLQLYVLRHVHNPQIISNRLKEYIKISKEFMEDENYTHYYFLKSIFSCKYPTVLPPGFPKHRDNYSEIPYNGSMDFEDYLYRCDVRTLSKGFIEVENVFYDLIFYINSHNSSLVRNTLITCLSNPKNDDERLRNLKKFGIILKELGYIKPNFNELLGRDERGIRLKDNSNEEVEQFKSFFMDKIANEFMEWKNKS